MVKKDKIQNPLRRALLLESDMDHALYRFELEEHIAYWKEGLEKDSEQYVFAVTEKYGNVAMLLITAGGTLLINEKARDELKKRMKGAYKNNMEILLPQMAEELADGYISVNGVKTI